MKHLHRLWGFKVKLEQVNELDTVEVIAQCPKEEESQKAS
jgi:spore cortex formation protein SpoVR/YcgB (stage V sporulation)